MRIVGGTARGRALQGPRPGVSDIRPTADRVRESLFNVLGQSLEPIDVLDLYAGTGALGLEAISRGAAKAVLVDSGREALGLCRANVEALGFSAQVEVRAMPVQRALERLGREGRRFSLVFADPPYAARAGEALLEALQAAAVVVPGGLVVIEHDKRETLPESHAGFIREDARAYGDTRVGLFRWAG